MSQKSSQCLACWLYIRSVELGLLMQASVCNVTPLLPMGRCVPHRSFLSRTHLYHLHIAQRPKNMERGDNSWHQLIRTCAPACSHITLPRTSLADTTGRVSSRARRQHTTFLAKRTSEKRQSARTAFRNNTTAVRTDSTRVEESRVQLGAYVPTQQPIHTLVGFTLVRAG